MDHHLGEMRRIIFTVCIVALSAIISACRNEPRELVAQGTVLHAQHLYAESLISSVGELPSLDLRLHRPGENETPDEFFEDRNITNTVAVWGEFDAKWANRFESALWLDLGPILEGSTFEKRLTSLSAIDPELGNTFFIPTHLSFVGIIRNSNIHATSPADMTWDQFNETLSEIKSHGIYPISIGGAFAAPSLALFGLLDLRMNGADAYLEMIDGARSVEDKSFDSVFLLLDDWKKADYIHPDSFGWSPTDALSSVAAGESAFTILSGSAASRLNQDLPIELSPFPSVARGTRSELARYYGYSLTGSQANLEGALAFIELVFESALVLPNQSLDSITGLSLEEDSTFPDQVPFIANGQRFVPTPEALLDAQTAYDLGTVFTRYWRDEEYSASAMREQIGRFLSRGDDQ